MADVTINTQSAQYQQRLSVWNDMIAALRPRLRRFYSMPPSKQVQWRSLDPMIDSVLTFCETIGQYEGGDDA